MDKRRQ